MRKISVTWKAKGGENNQGGIKMKKKIKVFHVEVKRVHFVSVEAATKDEAIAKVDAGDGDDINGDVDFITTGLAYEVKGSKAARLPKK